MERLPYLLTVVLTILVLMFFNSISQAQTSFNISNKTTGDTLLHIDNDGKVGIGTTSPTAELHVERINGVLFTGSYGSGAIPIEGAGTRMMWYPRKAAFRSGYINGTQWDDINIGYFSTAMGFGATASGETSMALGFNTTASGSYSTAVGNNTTASGNFSTAIGREIEAAGNYSVAIALSDQNGLQVTQDSTMAIMGGNVGIGTISPNTKLEVADTIYSTVGGFKFPDGSVQATAAGNPSLWNQNGSDLYYNSGNVGIGTGTPFYPLTIFPGTSLRGLSINHNQTGAGHTYGVHVDLNKTSTDNSNVFGVYSDVTNNNGTNNTYGLSGLATGTSAGPKYGVRGYAYGSGPHYGVHGHADGSGVQYGVYGHATGTGTLWSGYFTGNVYAGGNLGIGTLTPSTPLEVVGTIQSSSGGFMFPDGTTQTTAATGVGTGNTLDQAYDQGGAGVGRIITADVGAVTVAGVDGFLSTGTLASGTIPTEGPGTRMMWYPAKGAFRAGHVYGTNWDDVNIGNYSIGLGANAQAAGNNSISLGGTTLATAEAAFACTGGLAAGMYSISMGNQSQADGNSAVGIGDNSRAQADRTLSLGYGSICNQERSTAVGYNASAAGIGATSIGYSNGALGDYSTAMGYNTSATGNYSTAIGSDVTISGAGSFITGDNSPTAFSQTGDNSFYARFANGYNLYTNSASTIGVTLAASGNSWSSISDSTKKENFKAVDGEEFLNKISKFNLTSWNYKGQDATKFRHYGPMAQDFYAAFGHDGIGTIGNDTTLASADFDGVNLIAIQALEKRTSQLKEKTNEINDLKNEIALLKSRIEKFESLFSKVEELTNPKNKQYARNKDNLK